MHGTCVYIRCFLCYPYSVWVVRCVPICGLTVGVCRRNAICSRQLRSSLALYMVYVFELCLHRCCLFLLYMSHADCSRFCVCIARRMVCYMHGYVSTVCYVCLRRCYMFIYSFVKRMVNNSHNNWSTSG